MGNTRKQIPLIDTLLSQLNIHGKCIQIKESKMALGEIEWER